MVSAVYATSMEINATASNKSKQKQVPTFGNFTHFGEALRKDVDFMKKKVSVGIEWANKAFHIPQVTKALDDVLWLRALEKPDAQNVKPSPWPKPFYPGNNRYISTCLNAYHFKWIIGFSFLCLLIIYRINIWLFLQNSVVWTCSWRISMPWRYTFLIFTIAPGSGPSHFLKYMIQRMLLCISVVGHI